MKKIIFGLIGLLAVANASPVFAQSDETQQLLLDVQKLSQFRRILLDMKQGYQIISTGYDAIRDISRGNFNLHEAFLNGLLKVSPAVRNDERVGKIIRDQLRLVQEYKSAFRFFKGQGCFSTREMGYMESVYSRVMDESLKDLDELSTVLTAGKLRMSDEERLRAIDRIYDDMEGRLSFLRHFNNKTAVLAVQRIGQQKELDVMRDILGISNY